MLFAYGLLVALAVLTLYFDVAVLPYALISNIYSVYVFKSLCDLLVALVALSLFPVSCCVVLI